MIFSIILTLVGLIAAFFLYRIILKPYYLISFYRRQGIHMLFVPIVGTFERDFKNAEVHGDFYYDWNQLARQTPRPKAFGKNIESEAQLLLIDPEAIRQFFINHDQYIKHPKLFALSKELGANGLVLAEGAIWRKHRKLISMSFHYEFLRSITPDVIDICEELLDKLKAKNLPTINVMEEFKNITGEVIGRIFFGERLAEKEFKGQKLTTFLANLVADAGLITFDSLYLMFGVPVVKMGLTAKHRKLMEDIRDFRSWSENLVRQRMDELRAEYEAGNRNTKRKNIVDLFFEQRINNPNECLSDDEIIDEYIAFFSDGMDTTGHFISMASYYLLTNPKWQAKVWEEVKVAFADRSNISLDTLTGMETLNACMKETLRLAPPVVTGMERIALHDHDLAGIKIKKGTVIMCCHSANHLDPLFHDDPETFDPERWLKPSKSQETLKKYPSTFIPFSMGARNCLGQNLAQNEARIILGFFMKKFEYELADKNYKLRFTQRFLREPLDDIIYKIKAK
jgi:cytochrome P450